MTTTATAHQADCLCPTCCMADLDQHLTAQGIDPSKSRDPFDRVDDPQPNRPTGGSSNGRRPARTITEGQARFMRRLLKERDLTKLPPRVKVPADDGEIDGMSFHAAKALLDRLTGLPKLPEANKPSDGQLEFLRSLAEQKEGLTPEGMEAMIEKLDSFDVASKMIDYCKTLPNAQRTATSTGLEPGVYRVDETVYRVQKVRGADRLYAKQWDEHAKTFFYAPGAIARIRPEHRMSKEEAAAFGHRTGWCCVCGRELTDDTRKGKDGLTSLQRGIGPVCFNKV